MIILVAALLTALYLALALTLSKCSSSELALKGEAAKGGRRACPLLEEPGEQGRALGEPWDALT